MITEENVGVLIICSDRRLQERPNGHNYTAQFIREVAGCECYGYERPGGVLKLICNERKEAKREYLKELELFVKHGANIFFLVAHGGRCAAYNEKFKLFSQHEETETQHADLLEAARIIKGEFPNVDVRIFYADLIGEDSKKFIFREISQK